MQCFKSMVGSGASLRSQATIAQHTRSHRGFLSSNPVVSFTHQFVRDGVYRPSHWLATGGRRIAMRRGRLNPIYAHDYLRNSSTHRPQLRLALAADHLLCTRGFVQFPCCCASIPRSIRSSVLVATVCKRTGSVIERAAAASYDPYNSVRESLVRRRRRNNADLEAVQ
jgi:hypothetical protein